MTKPLMDLMRKDVEFGWNMACAEAFSAMKMLLTIALVL